MQAAKALKKAMESGNVEVLKEAIAAAKAQKVSQEAGEMAVRDCHICKCVAKRFCRAKISSWWLVVV